MKEMKIKEKKMKPSGRENWFTMGGILSFLHL